MKKKRGIAMNKFRRCAAIIAASAFCALMVPAVSAQAADAAPRVSCYQSIPVYDIVPVGRVDWNQNPSGCYPFGDSIRVCDTRADGESIYAKIENEVLGGSTEGHTAGYCTQWQSRNLTKGKKYTLDVWGVIDGQYFLLKKVPVTG